MGLDSRCQQCDAPLSGQAVGGLCANCLLKLALKPEAKQTYVAWDRCAPAQCHFHARREHYNGRCGQPGLCQFWRAPLWEEIEDVERAGRAWPATEEKRE